MKITIRYFTTRTRRDGTRRYYWQPSGALQKAGWKVKRLAENTAGAGWQVEQAAVEEAKTLNKILDDWYAGISGMPVMNTKHGSIEATIEGYKKSRGFLKLAPKTQGGYAYAFRAINRWAGDSPIAALSPRLVKKFYEAMQKETPAKAAAIIRVLRLLCSWAVTEDLIALNPARNMRLGAVAKKGRIWSPQAVQYIVAVADAQGHHGLGTAIFLNEWLGQRKGDIITLQAQAYQGGVIRARQSKTGAEVELPVDMIPSLKSRIENQLARNKAAPVASTFLIAGANGLPYSEYWFTHLLAKIRTKAAQQAAAEGTIDNDHPLYGLDKLIFKDLRHTAVTRLAEAGCTIPEIASITGHTFRSCENIIDRYNVRTARMAAGAFRRRLAAENQPERKDISK